MSIHDLFAKGDLQDFLTAEARNAVAAEGVTALLVSAVVAETMKRFVFDVGAAGLTALQSTPTPGQEEVRRGKWEIMRAYGMLACASALGLRLMMEKEGMGGPGPEIDMFIHWYEQTFRTERADA